MLVLTNLRTLLPRAGGLSKAKTYLPTPSDTGVSSWLSWLTQFGEGGPKWFGGGSDGEAAQKLSYTDLFDNWELHSKWCPSCRKSLKFLGRADAFLSKAALVLLICGAVSAAIRRVKDLVRGLRELVCVTSMSETH